MSSGRFSNLEMGGGQEPDARSAAAGRPVAPSPAADNPFATRVKDAGFYLQEAVRHELDGCFEEELRAYANVLAENPLLPEAWTGQIWTLLELGEYPEARLWADKALERFPEHPALLGVKALALFRMGLAGDARALNDTALQKKGEHALTWLCRGEIMLGGSGAAGEECFQHALRLASPDDPTLLRVAGCAMRLQAYSTAIPVLQTALARHPRSARAWYLHGLLLEHIGRSHETEAAFKQAAALAPQNRVYRQLLPYQKPGAVARFRAWLRKVTGS